MGDLLWSDMLKKLKTLVRVNDKPHYLNLHCGTNDVGKIKLKDLINSIKSTLEKNQLLLSNTMHVIIVMDTFKNEAR